MKLDYIKEFRAYRSDRLSRIAKPLVKAGVTADQVTALSLISGLLAVYFLFTNYYLLVLFALLHLLFDGFDGVIARLTKTSIAGKYLDLVTDNLVTIGVLIKTAIFLQDFYAFIAAGLFSLALTIHIISKLKAPILFIRTVSLIVLTIALNPSFPFAAILLTAGYLAAGGVSSYSLTRQLQWHLNR